VGCFDRLAGCGGGPAEGDLFAAIVLSLGAGHLLRGAKAAARDESSLFGAFGKPWGVWVKGNRCCGNIATAGLAATLTSLVLDVLGLCHLSPYEGVRRILVP